MDQVLLFAGIYGFLGSILIVLFKIWPDVFDWRIKKNIISSRISHADCEEVFKSRKFFPDSDEKILIESRKTYDFYSTLWGFRLIGTGFMITIINALFPSTFVGSVYNSLFVITDAVLLVIVSMYGLEGVSRYGFTIKPLLFIFIFGFNLIFLYFPIGALNFSFSGSTRLFFVDNLLIASTAISQIIFTSIFWLRYFVRKK